MTTRMRSAGLRGWAAAATAGLALTACGGGGGGDDRFDGTSGLMPAAPASGAVLVADATALRPLADGAVWRYHGTDRPGDNTISTSYDNERRVSARATDGVTETDSNAYGLGTDSIAIAHRGGSVVRTESVSFSPLMPAETLEMIELRSPVRLNDQVALYDRRLRGIVPDSDGDGVGEDADIAAYRRVIGEETVTLAALGERRTVRVDLVTLVRVRLSRDGRLSAVATVEQHDWYAVGVGVVKRVLVQPSGSGRRITTEELVNWHDGAVQGLGVMPTVALRAPAAQPSWSDAPTSNLHAAIKVGDRIAMVASPWAGGAAIVMTADLGGTLQGLWRMDARTLEAANSASRHWTSDGTRLLLVRREPLHATEASWAVKTFGTDAQPEGASEGAMMQLPPAGPAGGNLYVVAVAADAGRFWALWIAYPNGEDRSRLMLGAFAADGRALGTAHELDAATAASTFGAATGFSDRGPALAAGAAGVLATWQNVSNLRYAWLPALAPAPTVRTLATATGFDGFGGFGAPILVPAVSAAGGLLAWSRPLALAGSFRPPAQVLRIDAAGVPQFASGRNAFDTPFADTRRNCEAASTLYSLVADEAGAALTTSADCWLYPDDPSLGANGTRRPLRHLFIDDRNTPLADAVPSLPMVTRHGQPDRGHFALLFRDRLLLLAVGTGGTAEPIRLTTVWRR